MTNFSALSGKNVLVTGAAGFIGSHLARRLAGLGCRVYAGVRPGSDVRRLREETLPPYPLPVHGEGEQEGTPPVRYPIELVEMDLGKPHPLTPSLPQGLPLVAHMERGDKSASLQPAPEIVFHLASAGVNQGQQDAAAIIQTNVNGTLHLLQQARGWAVERFVNCGSCFEYASGSRLSEDVMPRPNAEYGASKTAAWVIAHAFYERYRLPVVTLRPFTVYGPGEGAHRLIPHTIANALKGEAFKLTGGEQTRDFVYVEEVVDAFIAAAVQPKAVGGTFNVCTGVETSVKELVTIILELSGSSAAPLFGALPYRDTEIWSLSGDPAKAEAALGWRAQTPLRAGLAKTIAWFRENSG